MLNRIVFLFALSAVAGFGQYTWHTTTTVVPPSQPPWLPFVDGNTGYYSSQSQNNGEVRTTMGTLVNGNWQSYTHNLGITAVPDNSWDPTTFKYHSYLISLSGVPGSPYNWTLTITRRSVQDPFYYSYEQLGSYSVSAPSSGTVFSSSIRDSDGPNGDGRGIHIRIGTQAIYHRIAAPAYVYSSGYNGFTVESGPIAEVRVGYLETIAPNTVTGLVAPVSNGVMNASWNATSDNANGIGSVRYEVFRGTASLGTTAGTTWSTPANPGDSFTLTVKAYDGHRNFNAGSSIQVTVPPASSGLVDDSRRVGIHAQSAQWGAMGESIDMRSMNLNYTVPLLKAQGRGGVGLGLSLNYNSQNWRKEGSTVSKVGADVGYGFGWKLLAGSIIPVYSNPTTLSYYIFTDSTGAEYKLDVNSGNVWSGKQGVYVWFDANTYKLHFADGSFWRMESTSGASEQDAGTRYPTVVQDRHGNQVKIYYKPSIGGSIPNQSARIDTISDVRAPNSAYNWGTYVFSYNADAIPHLTGISNQIGTSESYTLNYSGSQGLYEPFTNAQQFGTAVWLNSLVQNGVNLTTSFLYNSGGEMTKITFPLGGEMLWNYTNQSYAGSRQMREVLSRDFRKASGAATVNYAFTHPSGDSSLKYHSETTLADPSNVGQRRWSFFTTTDYRQGLSSKYEELDNWVVKSRVENTWTQTAYWPSTTVMPYISEVLNTIDVGLSSQKQSRTTQAIDAYGNNWGTNTYAYNSPTTHLRGQGCIPLAQSNAGVAARRIYSVPASCSVSENGVALSGGTWVYDGTNPGLAALPGGIRLWEDPQTTVRALMTSANDGYALRTMAYNLAGQPVNSSDGQGLSQSVTYGGVGGSMVPTQITPNSNSSLGSSMNWNGFLGLTSVSSGNGASQFFGYDAYARPSTTNSADGAQTVYSYSTSPAFSTASINSRWSKTYYDGVGRPVKVESGDAGGVKSTVLTEYEPCACSPMGKMKRVSLPYAPGGTVYWTVYTYDGLGRTLSVAQPNGSGTTTYLYVGNTVKVTSPSGKWKQYEMDAIGRMTLVTEPRPGGGTYTTSYGYNVAGKLVSVSMPRDGVTQTRTFAYDTTSQSRLLSATNPENGTVNYTYNLDGTTATKVDAKGSKTEFSYDAYKRVLQMRKFSLVSGNLVENRCQRIDYFYDEGGGSANGRLTRVKWNWKVDAQNAVIPCDTAGGFEEAYSYNAAGRILSKSLTLTKKSGANTGSAYLIANWAYNNEGQVTNVTYPNRFEGLFQSQRLVTHGYDSMARLNSVQTKLATEVQQNPAWQSVISGVQFNAFGAVTSLNHLGVTESRTYNILGQMTRMTKGSLIDVEYRFSATANDGKILSQKNWLSGEDVTYQYDELERLISASTTAGTSWGLSWSYDGFGNRLSQSVTQGTGPSSVTLVNGNTNRISSAGYSYDSNGNMTQMPKGSGSMTLDYDLSNRVSGVSHPDGSEQYRYSPDNRRVWRSAGRTACYASRDNTGLGYWSGSGEGATEQVILYSPGGQKMGAYCLSFSANLQYFAVTASEENVYYGGRVVGKRLVSVTNSNNGLVSDFTADRLQSKGNGSNYYPYGESKTSTSGDDREGFATYTRDEKSGLDYADQRWYASGVGRFGSPDPYTASSIKQDPASWNRFSYVRNSPINRTDRAGLEDEDVDPVFKVTALALLLGQSGGGGGGGGGGDSNPGGIDVESGPEGDDPGPAQIHRSPEQIMIDNAWAYASDLIFKEKCAKLFLGSGSITLEQRKSLSTRVISNHSMIRTLPQSAIPAGLGVNVMGGRVVDFIYFFEGRGFFTGSLADGKALSTISYFNGLSSDGIRAAMLLHEFLHLFGGAGPDSKGEIQTLPNGQIVKGSDGVSAAVVENCLK